MKKIILLLLGMVLLGSCTDRLVFVNEYYNPRPVPPPVRVVVHERPRPIHYGPDRLPSYPRPSNNHYRR